MKKQKIYYLVDDGETLHIIEASNMKETRIKGKVVFYNKNHERVQDYVRAYSESLKQSGGKYKDKDFYINDLGTEKHYSELLTEIKFHGRIRELNKKL